jgi:protein-tyrosine-phosphatase
MSTQAGSWKCLLLCSSTNGVTPLLQSLVRHGASVDVIVCGSPSHLYAQGVDRTIHASPVNTLEELAALAKSWDERHPYRMIVATSDPWVAALNLLDPECPVRRKAQIAPPAAINVALSTVTLAKTAREAGVEVVDSWLVGAGSIPEAPQPFPFLMRSVALVFQGANGVLVPETILCSGVAAYEDFLENYGRRVDTEVLAVPHGRRLSLLCLCSDGEVLHAFASEPLHQKIPGGTASFSRSVACEDPVLDAARKLIRALGWHGVASLEFSFGTGGSPTLIDMRTGWERTSAHAISAGVNLPSALSRLLKGDLSGEHWSYRSPMFFRDLEDDIDWIASGKPGALHVHPRESGDSFVATVKRVLSGQEVWKGFRLSDPTSGLHTLGRLARRGLRRTLRRIKAPVQRRRMYRCHNRNIARFTCKASAGTLMFVCHGNICRSPLAETLARSRVPEWKSHSTGLHALPGSRSPGRIQRVALALGADLESHRSTLIDESAVKEADMILIMDTLNYLDFVQQFPRSVDKLFFLGMFGTYPVLTIPDPVNMDPEAARASATQLADAIEGFARWLRTKDAS